MQIEIPYMHLRGGSSKGLYFRAADLPADEKLRNRYLLTAMEGSDAGDPRQIDGLGGGSSLSSKVAVVSPSTRQGADLDYYFVQVMPGKGKVSTTQTCGNILAGVLPFAIESGMIKATHPVTGAVIHMVNTGGLCEVKVETPDGRVNYAGNAKVDGVVGTSAPIVCNYLDTQGATCGTLFPTGNPKDHLDGIALTCIDNGMPVVLLRAVDFGLKGDEPKEALDANETLKNALEAIRQSIGPLMNLGDVKDQSIPKMCLISPPLTKTGVVHTRMFIPHTCHDAIGVLAAVSVASACALPGTIAEGIAVAHRSPDFSIEHPTGEMTVHLQTSREKGELIIQKSGVVRTARLLSRGVVYI